MNKANISLFMFIVIILSVSSYIVIIFSKYDPGFHLNAEYPLIFKIFLSFVILIAFILLLLFLYNSYYIFKSWNKLIPRHKFFSLFSFYFILVMFFLIISGIFQSYESNGIKLLMIFVLFNYYIIMLQLLWRFSA